MCPICVTTLALIAAGTGSVGGLAAVVVRKISAKPGVKEPGPQRADRDAGKEGGTPMTPRTIRRLT